MQEILFRGKRARSKDWTYGYYYKHEPAPSRENLSPSPISYIIKPSPTFDLVSPRGIEFEDVIPETVGQFTGKCDKNGTKIFDGDICRFAEWKYGKLCWIGKVSYECQEFIISGGKNEECAGDFIISLSRIDSERIEVISNIHDNPELLGKQP